VLTPPTICKNQPTHIQSKKVESEFIREVEIDLERRTKKNFFANQLWLKNKGYFAPFIGLIKTL
jgi:hypothetical protein